jgi:hypothetical protein
MPFVTPTRSAHVGFGSEADIEAPLPDVRFTPQSRHSMACRAQGLGATEQDGPPH